MKDISNIKLHITLAKAYIADAEESIDLRQDDVVYVSIDNAIDNLLTALEFI